MSTRRLRPPTALLALVALAASFLALSPAPAAPRGDYHHNTVLVAFDAGMNPIARAALHAALGGRVANTMAWMNLDVVRLPDGVDPLVAAGRYSSNPLVAYAEPNWVVRLLATPPNDILFNDQWGFHNTGQRVNGSLVLSGLVPDADIDGPEGWEKAFGAGSFPTSGGTRVAIIDTGIDRSHVDLLGKVKACASATTAIGIVVEGTCSDDNLHGTHVAGTVAANTGNTAGVAGTAPNAELAIFKALNGAGVGFLADIVAGIRWAYTTGGGKVLSMSFGSDAAASSEAQAVKDANSAGALLVAAAGNDFDDTKNYPAYYPEVMSVAAHNQADMISDFSNCNSDVEIAAPGEDIWSTFPGNSYGIISGTSMATPHVAGVAAMIISELGLTNTQTRNQLKSTAVTISKGNGRSLCNGYKRVNLDAALAGVAPPPPPPEPGAITGKVSDQKSKAAIANATVNCGTAGSATTATNGTYTISNVTPGTYTCTASKSGYASKSSSVTVNSASTTTANFALRKL